MKATFVFILVTILVFVALLVAVTIKTEEQKGTYAYGGSDPKSSVLSTATPNPYPQPVYSTEAYPAPVFQPTTVPTITPTSAKILPSRWGWFWRFWRR